MHFTTIIMSILKNIFIANDSLRFSISKQFRFNYVHIRNVNVIKFHLKHMTFNKICMRFVEYYVCCVFACQIQYINNILGLIIVANHFAWQCKSHRHRFVEIACFSALVPMTTILAKPINYLNKYTNIII